MDGVLAHEFALRLNENLSRTRDRLLDPGFCFRPLRPVFIPKKDGSDRIICIPTVEDRLIQRLLLRYIDRNDKLSIATPVSYGFRPGRGIQTALKKSRNLRHRHPWVLKSDITSFFDSISRAPLKERIARRLRNSSAVRIITAAIDAEIDDADERDAARIARAGIIGGTGLRQGMPLSPALSNFVLREFDLTLHKYGVNMVRYADDLLILADSEWECVNHLALVRNRLKKLGHHLPELGSDDRTKTAIFKPKEPVEFLGFELRWTEHGYQIFIPDHAFKEAKARLQEFESFEHTSRKWRLLSKAITAIQSKIEGYLSVYRGAKNFADFSSHAANCRKNTITSLLSSIFGVDAVSRLDEERMAFLGLADL